MIDDLNSEAAKIPSIGGLEGVTDPAVKKALLAIKETLEIYAGTRPRVSWLDKVLTNRDAFDYGVIGVVVNGQTVTGGNGGSVVSTSQPPAAAEPALDLTPPGAPLGLIATGTKLAVLLEWGTPASTVAYTEIIRAAVDNIGLAVLIGTTSATIYADIIGATDVTNYYWIRFVSKNGVAGAYNSISGTMAVTGRLGSNDLISVDGAKIIDATILNAKIANVSADKITTGTLAVGQAIQVGAVANRIFIDGSGIIRSGGMLDYLNGNGFYLRATAGSAQVAFGNATTYIGFNGTDLAIQTPNFKLTNSSLTFNGSGTFSGSLLAATGTFAGALQAATGSFSGHLNAATGSFGGSLLAGVLDFTQLNGVLQNFSTPGMYSITVPVGKTTLRASLSGGSGGGGGAGNINASGGGGGGGSGLLIATFTGLIEGATYTVVVGSRGLKGARAPAGGDFSNYGQPGSAGGASQVVGLLTCTGGQGGGAGGPINPGGAGGAGGTNASAGLAGAGNGTGGAGGGSLAGNSGGNGGSANIVENTAQDGQNGFVLIEFFNPNAVVIRTDYNILLSALQRQGIAIT